MTRTGKIARLPGAIRNQLNQRLADGVPGVKLVAWLNSLPEVRGLLKEQFDGRPINEVNLSEWKGGGFVEWQMQQELMASAKAMAEDGTSMKAELEGVLTEHLSLVVAARYAQLLRGWDGEVDEGFTKKLKGLKSLCQDVAVLRRGDQREARQELNEKKFEQSVKDEQVKALEFCLEEADEYPEAALTLKKAFALLKAYALGQKKNKDYEAEVRQLEAAKREREEAKEKKKREQERQREASRHGVLADGHHGDGGRGEPEGGENEDGGLKVEGGHSNVECEPSGNPGESDLIQPDEGVKDDRANEAEEAARWRAAMGFGAGEG